MSKILYNEGRVVGYSAYEIYVRQLLADDPNATPATEKEWLSSTIAMGSSMLLHVGTDDVSGAHYRDIIFPSNCKLAAANTIIASIFIGDGYPTSVVSTEYLDIWSTRVTDYGKLISNTAASHPDGVVSHNGTVPAADDVSISATTMEQLRSYMKITDGVIIQPGTWSESTNTPPEMDFTPNYGDYPRLRISFSDMIEHEFYLLLTGFTDRGVLKGTTGSTSATATSDPDSGDFLGPGAFPWAAKVIFSVPPLYMQAFVNASYTRQLPTGTSAQTVSSAPIIDMSHTDPISDYYATQDTDATIDATVTNLDISSNDAAIIATIMHSDNGTDVPPALYGGIINGAGNKDLAPLDVVAPGTLHLYHGDLGGSSANTPAAKVTTLETQAHGAKAFARSDSDYTVSERDADSDMLIPVAKVEKTSLFGALSSEPRTAPLLFVQGTLRSGITIRWTGADMDTTHSGGTAYGNSSVVPSENTDYWYLDVDESISDEYTLDTITLRVYDSSTSSWTTSTVSGISGATASDDPMPFCDISCMIHKRVSGKLSDVVKNVCGYTGVYDSNGDPAGVFASGGAWASATKDMFTQIDAAERANYYAIIPSSADVGNAIAWPVKTDGNNLDVTVRYQFKIIINGTVWNIPHFTNTLAINTTSTRYLGSWWNVGTKTHDAETDTYTATVFRNGWANIDSTAAHPLVYNTMSGGAIGQIYQRFAMLPITNSETVAMNVIFGDATLESAGILPGFRTLSLSDFLETALYTDMGTGAPLIQSGSAEALSNIMQTTVIYTNTSYDIGSLGTYASAADLETANPAADNAGRNAIVSSIISGNTVYTRYMSNGTSWIAQYPYNLSDITLCNVQVAFQMPVANSVATVGKTQFLPIPEAYQNSSGTDPIGLVVSTGRLQGLALSMADYNNTPYSIYGNHGAAPVEDNDSDLSWCDLLTALTQNKKIDILGAVLKGLKSNITGSGAFYIQFGSGASEIRLYITKTVPTDTDIPTGSIGIGWNSSTVKYYNGSSWV